MTREIYAEAGGHCEDVFVRTRRALKHNSMMGDNPDYNDLLTCFVHAEANWIAFLLQSMNSLVPPDTVGLLDASTRLQEAVHATLQPRLGTSSPMPHYQFLLGGLMRVCNHGERDRGENALRSLYSILPEGRPAGFAKFSQVLMNTHKDAVARNLPSQQDWGDAVTGVRGLGVAIRDVLQ